MFPDVLKGGFIQSRLLQWDVPEVYYPHPPGPIRYILPVYPRTEDGIIALAVWIRPGQHLLTQRLGNVKGTHFHRPLKSLAEILP